MKRAFRRFIPGCSGIVALVFCAPACWGQAAPAAAEVAAQAPDPNPAVAVNPAPVTAVAPPRVASAAGSVASARVGSSAPVPAAPPKAWNELTGPQQQALKPLAASWQGIDEAQKRKWLAISRNFSAMTPTEQAKLHDRMSEWAALSPKQRTQARLNFAETAQVPPEEKKATWQAYQALSPEEKRKLAAGAPAQPTGAAPALKPVPAGKLATPPNVSPPRGGASSAAMGTASAASAPRQIDQKTLLPRKPASAP